MIIAFWIILGALISLGLGNLFTAVWQDNFIFRPRKLAADFKFEFEVPFKEINLKTEHHGHINVLWFNRHEEKRPMVLYNHGNSSDLSRWGLLCNYFDELGYDLLIYDFRGFGKSKGIRTERNFHLDAKAVYDFALDHYEPSNIVIYGRSMGCGVATKLAAENECKTLILETPFHSMPHLFRTYYPFLPLSLFKFKYEFRNDLWLPKVKCPVYIFQGTRDTVIPMRCAGALKPLMPKPENFIVIEKARHNNLSDFDAFQKKLKEILQPDSKK